MKTLTTLFFMTMASIGYCQVVYVDVVTPAVTTVAYNALKTEQNETNNKLSRIREAQLVINLQLERVNGVQEKIRKGLTEVNGTLQNGVMITRIARSSTQCYSTLEKIGQFVGENPEFAPFAIPQVNRMYEHVLVSYTQGLQAVTSDEFNWMNAGQRHNILTQVDVDMRTLNLLAHSTLSKLHRAKRIGFLRSINPFQNYYNTDMQIVNQVMSNYNSIKM